jgi:hypothetical protein
VSERVVDVCDCEISGRVTGSGRSKQDDGTYVRFGGVSGDVAVFVPDDVMPVGGVKAGERVVMAVDIGIRGKYTNLRAVSLRRDGAKPEGKP